MRRSYRCPVVARLASHVQDIVRMPVPPGMWAVLDADDALVALVPYGLCELVIGKLNQPEAPDGRS